MNSPIARFLGAGIALCLLGAFMMISAWPAEYTTGGYFGTEPTTTETGSMGVVALGSMTTFAGQLLVAVAVIAAGIKLARD